MRSTNRLDGRQFHLLDDSALPTAGASVALIDKPARGHSARDRVSVDLRGIGPRLRARAAQQQLAPAALLRKAALTLLDDEPAPADSVCPVLEPQSVRACPVVKVTLRVSAAHAALLSTRARASEMAQGAYVCALMDGAPPAPRPPDHAVSVRALSVSSDRLAAISADLNAFSRLIGHAPAAQLEPFRASLRSLVGDVRKHLAFSAVLIAELKPWRRSRP